MVRLSQPVFKEGGIIEDSVYAGNFGSWLLSPLAAPPQTHGQKNLGAIERQFLASMVHQDLLTYLLEEHKFLSRPPPVHLHTNLDTLCIYSDTYSNYQRILLQQRFYLFLVFI